MYVLYTCVVMSPGGEFISCIMLLQFIPVQEGYTALHFAALKQHADVVQCLLEGNSPCPDILAQVLSFPSILYIYSHAPTNVYFT